MNSTYWTYYTDTGGNRAELDITIEQNRIVLTTATGETLRFSPTEAAMLLENLEAATDYRMQRITRPM